MCKSCNIYRDNSALGTQKKDKLTVSKWRWGSLWKMSSHKM